MRKRRPGPFNALRAGLPGRLSGLALLRLGEEYLCSLFYTLAVCLLDASQTPFQRETYVYSFIAPTSSAQRLVLDPDRELDRMTGAGDE